MAFKKKTRTRVTSPTGTFHYPSLTKPDDKYADNRKPNGSYKCGLILDPTTDDAKVFISKLESIRDAYRSETIAEEESPKKVKAMEAYAVKPVFTEQVDDEGDATGLVIINASQAATIVTNAGVTHTFGVLVVDAARNKLTGQVWSGTKGKLSVDASGYDMATSKTFGVSLSLVAAQVIQLVNGSGNSTDASDIFGVEEGYTAPAESSDDAAEEVADESDF